MCVPVRTGRLCLSGRLCGFSQVTLHWENMKFLLILLLTITASDEAPSGGSDDGSNDGDKLKESQALPEIVKANTEFAIKLLQGVASKTPGENVVFSPASIFGALAMTSLGARAETRQEMLKTLSLNNIEENAQIHQEHFKLLQVLNEPRNSLQLYSGNGLFIDRTFTLLGSFQNDVQQLYHSEVIKTDFQDKEGAIEKINEYIKNNTKGKIEKLLQSLSSDTVMVLTNYYYFSGEWQKAFKPGDTKVQKFFVDQSTTVNVSMMTRTGRYDTFQDKELSCTVVRLPYKGNASMIIAAAKPGKIQELEQALSAETIQKWRESLQESTITLSVPKLSLGSSMQLKDQLQHLGMIKAFSNAADFSGISNQSVKVGNVVHKAIIIVDEKGTVAAAATAVEMVPLSQIFAPEIVIDGPFILIIFDEITGLILFIAKIQNPALE